MERVIHSLIVLQEPLHALLHGLLEGGELEASGRLHQTHQLLVRCGLPELTIRLGGVELIVFKRRGSRSAISRQQMRKKT